MPKYQDLSKEELLKLIEKQEAELKSKKYGLVWDSEKEPEKVVLDCENNIPVLKRVKEKEIRTDESEDNILIEWDNYHALTCLNYTHKGKVDIIYIDPPYNTWAKDWKYNNDYVDKNDWYRHSKWLNMIKKRLELSKNLLSETWVILFAIDDHELATSKLLLDKIFGEQNYISTICIEINPAWQNIRDNSPAISHDYCLIYAKDIEKSEMILRDLTDGEIKNYKFIDDKGERYSWDNLRRRWWNSRPSDRPWQWFPIYVDFKSWKMGLEHFKWATEVFPIDPKGEKRIWRNNPEWFLKEYEKGNIWLIDKGDRIEISKKTYMPEGKKPKTIWKDGKYSATTHWTKLLIEILGTNSFTYPKSIHLVLDCLRYYAGEDATILDFFAGSGTTGHAVLKLNQEDWGRRKFILCTNNEVWTKDEIEFKEKYKITEKELREWQITKSKEWLDWCELRGICSSVTYPRIYNVINGYAYKGKDRVTLFEKRITFSQLKDTPSLLEEVKIIEENSLGYDEIEKKFEDNTIKIVGTKNIDGRQDGLGWNIQYFKTDLIPVERIDTVTDKQRAELTEEAGQMIAIKENTFDEVELNEWYQIFESQDKNRKTAIYFRESQKKFEELIEKMGDTKTTLYIFSYWRIDKKLYRSIKKNIIIEDIPEPILEIYKEINLTLKK